jgi:hypothetical protein
MRNSRKSGASEAVGCRLALNRDANTEIPSEMEAVNDGRNTPPNQQSDACGIETARCSE